MRIIMAHGNLEIYRCFKNELATLLALYNNNVSYNNSPKGNLLSLFPHEKENVSNCSEICYI